MAISRVRSNAEAAEEEAKNEALKKRAARQAVAKMAEPEPVEMVTCRVLKAGDGRISMGHHVPGFGDAFFEKGETFEAERATADELENRGFVEIQDAPPAKAPAA